LDACLGALPPLLGEKLAQRLGRLEASTGSAKTFVKLKKFHDFTQTRWKQAGAPREARKAILRAGAQAFTRGNRPSCGCIGVGVTPGDSSHALLGENN